MTMVCYERLDAFLDRLECTCGNCVQHTWASRDIAIENVISNGVMGSNRTNHLQDCKEVAQVGIWGRQKGSPRNQWDFRLQRNHKLVKISIDHGDLIYSLKFTTQDGRGYLHESEKVGGWNGGRRVSEVTFDDDEEIIGISGTVGVSRGKYAGYTIISSLSFITNKRTHGPFGQARGTKFAVPWNKGSFAGFYGLCGYYIDAELKEHGGKEDETRESVVSDICKMVDTREVVKYKYDSLAVDIGCGNKRALSAYTADADAFHHSTPAMNDETNPMLETFIQCGSLQSWSTLKTYSISIRVRQGVNKPLQSVILHENVSPGIPVTIDSNIAPASRVNQGVYIVLRPLTFLRLTDEFVRVDRKQLQNRKSQEGAPTAKELGESSYRATSRTIPITGEPIHHTVPLLAARLVRHEDRLDAIATILNNFPNELVEILASEVDKLIIDQQATETAIEQLSTQFGESMEFIGILCSASTTLDSIMASMDRELSRIKGDDVASVAFKVGSGEDGIGDVASVAFKVGSTWLLDVISEYGVLMMVDLIMMGKKKEVLAGKVVVVVKVVTVTGKFCYLIRSSYSPQCVVVGSDTIKRK
ncbi:jacalin-like lectin domain, Transposase-associated domain protein [Artemisia annua]|uniref:Jacalin-like lectin domain, Transposase-associated domain protein n=1 Tax=Artemisia annua TaxID=35608 RepID=A0A2U1MW26_ARTAN|nr:jacalin-like lectin domain, Transposase-associated domain protein [Artemisia annua]